MSLTTCSSAIAFGSDSGRFGADLRGRVNGELAFTDEPPIEDPYGDEHPGDRRRTVGAARRRGAGSKPRQIVRDLLGSYPPRVDARETTELPPPLQVTTVRQDGVVRQPSFDL
jgi:hypothetical protein